MLYYLFCKPLAQNANFAKSYQTIGHGHEQFRLHIILVEYMTIYILTIFSKTFDNSSFFPLHKRIWEDRVILRKIVWGILEN